jgi:hypothetical protein
VALYSFVTRALLGDVKLRERRLWTATAFSKRLIIEVRAERTLARPALTGVGRAGIGLSHRHRWATKKITSSASSTFLSCVFCRAARPCTGMQLSDVTLNATVVTKTDIAIDRLASELRNSPEKWNHAITACARPTPRLSVSIVPSKRRPMRSATAFSIAVPPCKKPGSSSRKLCQRQRLQPPLMDYNNDPTTTFADIQGVFWLVEKHIAMRLPRPQSASVATAAAATVTKIDLQVVKRVRELLDSSAKWNRADKACDPDAGYGPGVSADDAIDLMREAFDLGCTLFEECRIRVD